MKHGNRRAVVGPLWEGAVEHKRDWGREFKIFILSLRRGVKKTCLWHVFSPDLGGYAAVADTSLSEGGFDTTPAYRQNSVGAALAAARTTKPFFQATARVSPTPV